MKRFANHSEKPYARLDLRTFDENDPLNPPAAPPNGDPQVTDPQLGGGDPQPPATPQPQGDEFDVIKHNKEEVKIPVTERQAYLQKGYDYDNVRTERDTLKQQTAYIDRLAKMSGYQNADDFIKAVDEYEQTNQIQQEAQKLGIDPQAYSQAYQQHIAPTNEKMTKMDQELQELRSMKVDMALNDLGVQDKDLRGQVKELVKTKGYDVQDAYKILTYDNIGKKTEQEVLANITNRDQKQILPSNDKGGNLQFDPKNMSMEDIEKISQRVQQGERISF